VAEDRVAEPDADRRFDAARGAHGGDDDGAEIANGHHRKEGAMDAQDWVKKQRDEIRRQVRTSMALAEASVQEVQRRLGGSGVAEDLIATIQASVGQVVTRLRDQLSQMEGMVGQIGSLARSQDDLRKAFDRVDGARRAFERQAREQLRTLQRQQAEFVKRLGGMVGRAPTPAAPKKAAPAKPAPKAKKAAPKAKAGQKKAAPKAKAGQKKAAPRARAKTAPAAGS